MTEEELEKLQDNFESSEILEAVDSLDTVRGILAEPEDGLSPPQIRIDLLELHQLAMSLMHNGNTSVADEFFSKTEEIYSDVEEMAEALEGIRRTLDQITRCYPESDFD